MLKNLFDRFTSLTAITLLLVPVFIPIWLLVRLTSRGAAIYSHTRVGKNCEPFQLYKFRSMYVGSDAHGFQTQEADPRITPIGKFLRKTSIDELPQLFNVLKGDMSLVGPRPDTPMQKENYRLPDWQLRHQVRPGITGLAQINGRSNISTEDRLHFDLLYARKPSLKLDLKILLKTLGAIRGSCTN